MSYKTFYFSASFTMKSLSRVRLCDAMDCTGSFIHGIFQARILEWVAISFSRGSSRPRDRTPVSLTAGRLFTIYILVNRCLSRVLQEVLRSALKIDKRCRDLNGESVEGGAQFTLLNFLKENSVNF